MKAFFFLLAAILIAPLFGRPVPADAAGPHKTVVLVRGLGVSTPPWGPLRGLLADRGYSGADVIEFSYGGGGFDALGLWSPRAATPCQNMSTGSFDVLDRMLSDLAAARPDDRIVLVGHSFGGLVAFEQLGRVLGDRPPSWSDRLASLVTFDSPLGGVSAERALGLGAAWGLARGCTDTSVVRLLAGMQVDPGRPDRDRQLVAGAAGRGIAVGTAGNRLDCLFASVPRACLSILELPDDSVTQVIDNAQLGWYEAAKPGQLILDNNHDALLFNPRPLGDALNLVGSQNE